VLFLASLLSHVLPAFGQDEKPSPQLEARLHEVFRDAAGPIHYFSKQVDLGGDGGLEFVVHVAGPMVCGSGGCSTLVFTPGKQGLELLAAIAVTRPPIIVAESATNGWRDLVVRVSGGGILPGYDARLRFDGSTYPKNPTVEPAQPLDQEAQGTVAIPAFGTFTEGRLLRAAPQ
jgi:hypothetical protein